MNKKNQHLSSGCRAAIESVPFRSFFQPSPFPRCRQLYNIYQFYIYISSLQGHLSVHFLLLYKLNREKKINNKNVVKFEMIFLAQITNENVNASPSYTRHGFDRCYGVLFYFFLTKQIYIIYYHTHTKTLFIGSEQKHI